jgi:hypothetical protein
MLSAITFSMLFIFYLLAVMSYIASARRQNGNWAGQTKEVAHHLFSVQRLLSSLFLGFSLSLCVLILIFCFSLG